MKLTSRDAISTQGIAPKHQNLPLPPDSDDTLLSSTVRCFFELELELLSCSRLKDLVDSILLDLKNQLNLSEVNLILFDPEHTARALLENSQWLKPNFNLRFVQNHSLLAQLYPNNTAHSSSTKTPPPTYLQQQLFDNVDQLMSYTLLPLVREGYLIGGLHIGTQVPGYLDVPSRHECLLHYASVVSVCIENCITQENLTRLSIIDMLTKVNNRRSFDQELQKEVARASRGNYPLSCIFLDIDYFKLVNDRYGHAIGDRVLRTVGQFLRQQVRKSDFVSRYGGEEFALLLPDCSEEKALEIAQQLRVRFNGMIFRTDQGKPFKLTSSIGVSTCHTDQLDKDYLMQLGKLLVDAADSATYESKHAGRDQVNFTQLKAPEIAPELIEQRPLNLA